LSRSGEVPATWCWAVITAIVFCPGNGFFCHGMYSPDTGIHVPYDLFVVAGYLLFLVLVAIQDVDVGHPYYADDVPCRVFARNNHA